MYLKDPTRIESTSMENIDKAMADHMFTLQELNVVKRMIHNMQGLC